MTWKENLFQNILALTILLILGIIIYCKITGKTIAEIIRSIKEAGQEIEQ